MTGMRPTGPRGERRAHAEPPRTRRFLPRETAEFATGQDRSTPRHIHGRGQRPARSQVRPGRIARAVRGLTGTLAVGWLVLALILVVVQLRASVVGQAGPGVVAVLAHLLVAVLAVALQAVADRRNDVGGGLATVGVVGLVFGALWFWWWA